MGITNEIKDTIELLKRTNINGCITGSSMLDDDFDTWSSSPDIDVFVYAENSMLDAANMLVYRHEFEPLNAGEEWKLARLRDKGMGRNAYLSTLKLKRGNVVVNVTYKSYKNNLFSVLSSFDMSIIMIGYDIRKKVMLDLRCGWNDMVPEDPDNRWSPSKKIAYPNPLRDQDVDMYGASMWVRQFDRCIKYWDRQYDTRPMARFYIKLIDGVIEKGQLFTTDKSEEAFKGFVTTYEPLRDKMVEWLKDKEDC